MHRPWRFRVIGSLLFVFDWYKLGTFLVITLDFFSQERKSVNDCWIPHDISFWGGNYIILDKQQGHITITDSHFRLVGKYLNFGKDNGQLSDPIGIKIFSNTLLISNWLSGNINCYDSI
jgi:hypothetical protein